MWYAASTLLLVSNVRRVLARAFENACRRSSTLRHCEERQRRSNPCRFKGCYGLLRAVRNDDGRRQTRQIDPTGKSAKTCPALARKIFHLTRRANQRYDSARLTRQEGRVAIVTNAWWDAVDADVTTDERDDRGRRSRVVLAPRCWRQVLRNHSVKRRWQESRSPGRARSKP